MEDRIDLHVHSTASDGTLTPTEVVKLAYEKGLKAIALTDHDSIDGIKEAKEAAKKYTIEVISGIEFSTAYKGSDIHLLGLFIDETNGNFVKNLKAFVGSRESRNDKMIEKLNELGFEVTKEDLLKEASDGVITRAHFGKMLLKKGYIKTIDEAFKKYIGEGCPAFIPREKVTPEQAIALTLEANGLPILAHPLLYKLKDQELNDLIESLIASGLKGIEAMYSLHSQQDESHLRRLARKYNLLITGGSDFHGSVKPHIDLGKGKGNLKVPYSILENLRQVKRTVTVRDN